MNEGVRYEAREILENITTKDRANIADKIFSDKNIYTNYNILFFASKFILKAIQTKEQFEFADKIFSDKNLFSNDLVIKYTASFTEAIQTKKQIELADKIFSDKNIYNNEDAIETAKNIIGTVQTQEQFNLADKILSDKNLYLNKNVTWNAGDIIYSSQTKEQLELADKIFSDKNLYNNKNVMNAAGRIIRDVNTKDQFKLADKILSDKNLYNYEKIVYDLSKIIASVQTPEQYELADKILSDEKLYHNEYIQRIAKHMVQTKEQFNLVNKILSEKKFYDNHKVTHFIEKMIGNLKTKEQFDLVNKILSNRKLYNNYEVMFGSVDIINAVKTKEQYDLADKVLSEKDLYHNKCTIRYAGNIIDTVEIKEQFDLADKIFSDEKLHNNETVIRNASYIIQNVKTKEQFKIADKILSDENLYNDEDVIKYASIIIDAVKSKEQTKLANKILDNKNKSVIPVANSIIQMKADNSILDNLDERIDKVEALRIKFIENIDQFTAFSQDKFIDEEDAVKYINNYINIRYPDFLLNIDLFDKELTLSQIFLIIDSKNEISYKDLIKLNKTIGREKAKNLSKKDTKFAIKFIDIYKKQNINEIPREGKKKLLKELVASDKGLFNISDEMKKMFPIIPTNQKDYCKLLPSVVRSLGFDTNVILDKHFDEKLSHLGETLSNISDEDFKTLDIKQEYSRDEFIKDVHDKVKDLSREERQKVYDYFGFELHHNKKANTGFTITGYPMNLNNGEKLSQIKDPQTKAVIENLRENVIKFTQNNKIVCENKELENDLNNIIKSLPELRATIGLKQRGNGENFGHDYDVFTHSLKVMQGIVKDPKYQKLNDSDKKIMLFASLLHDIAKKEGFSDSHHADNSSFDASFIVKKFKLTQEEEIKLFTLIKNHEWNNYVNNASDEKERKRRQQSVAYDLRHDNLFDMSLIFTHADLKGVNDYFHDLKNEDRISKADGITRSYGEAADFHAQSIKKYIEQLKPSQPLLPVTKIPSSSDIEKSITEVKLDGSTNIKGVYKDKDGLIVIKYNELQNEDLEKIGFSCLSTTKGIEAKTSAGESVNTGNVKFFAHGFDEPYQLAKFDAFNLINSEVLLSVSYAERPESKYRFFRPQGILLDCDTKYVHGGGETDSGSGTGKFVKDFKRDYIFGGYREKDRKYISDLIKTALNMDDEKYKEFVEKYKNVPLSEIEPEETRAKLIKAFSEINSNIRKGKREYNEMYISNPKPPMAVFAYAENYHEKINNPLDFLNRTQKQKYESKSVNERTEFLREYALEHHVPFIVFGN